MYAGSLPSVPLTDVVSILHRCMLFPSKQLCSYLGVSPPSARSFNVMTTIVVSVWMFMTFRCSSQTGFLSGDTMFVALNCMNVVVAAMLGGELLRNQWYLNWNVIQVIMITRLYAMYQASRKMLIFLIGTLFVLTIAGGAITATGVNRNLKGKL